MKYDILADWLLNVYCNFSCAYCGQVKNNEHKLEHVGHKNIQRIIDFFDNSNLIWLIHMSGGEPFFHPKFVDLCQALTKKHYISINSNLSLNTVKDFISNINPQRVAFVHGSLHYQQRIKKHSVNHFMDTIRNIKKAGFKIYATQVFYPDIIPEYKIIFESFSNKNIIVRPKVFRGIYNNKLYPDSYTKEDRILFNKYSRFADKLDPLPSTHIDPSLDRQFISGNLSFRNLFCSAGRKYVWIKYNGDIARCYGSSEILGNIFENRIRLFSENKKCPYNICSCPYFGLKFAQGAPNVIRRSGIKLKIKNILSKIRM